MGFIVIGFVVFFIFCFFSAISGSKNKMTNEQKKYYLEERKLWGKGIDAKTSKQAKNILDQMEAGYCLIGKDSPELYSSSYRENINDIKQIAYDLECNESKQKAARTLDKFRDLYMLIISPTFLNVDIAYKAKNKCLKQWLLYFDSFPPDDCLFNSIQFFHDYLGDEYDPCMAHYASLDAKLSQCIETIKPEYRKKIQLRKEIIEYVDNEESVMRSELLNKQFSNCTKKELEYLYRELLKKYILVEHKIGNRYFVYLSDQEKAKREKKEDKKIALNEIQSYTQSAMALSESNFDKTPEKKEVENT